MFRFVLFAISTGIIILATYKSHLLASYIYYNYCNGTALGSPICLFILDFMCLGARSINNFWVYLATVISGLVFYCFNRLFYEIAYLQNSIKVCKKNNYHTP